MTERSRAHRVALPGRVPHVVLVALVGASGAFAQADTPAPDAVDSELQSVIVTARLRREDAEQIPVALSVVDSRLLDATGSFNVSQVTQLVPSMNYSSPNPRNTALTIRGLGSSVVAIAQANDGLEPGVGFYVDQVYHARPATAAFDLLDLARVEVLRGPQGTLFGKNTTAGAVNLVTQAPSFDTQVRGEASAGDDGYEQAKVAISGALVGDTLAGRLSAATTQRDGLLHNATTGNLDNNVDNAAIRGQLLYQVRENLSLRLTGDYSSVDTTCCTQVYVRVGATLKSPSRQYPALAAGLGYAPPSLNPYDFLTDIDSALKVSSHEGGVSAIADLNLGPFTLTSVSAWRFWDWAAANDRDYTRLNIQTIQGIPSRQDQFSQELRIASDSHGAIDTVAGLFAFTQTIKGNPVTAYGSQATYWLLGPTPTYPSNLLDGYRSDGHTRYEANSFAGFGEGIWHATRRLDVTAGLRYTYEDNNGSYNTAVSGGLATNVTALVNAKLSILRPQSYSASDADGSLSGRLNATWHWNEVVMSYLSVARVEKSGGINMSGLPLTATNQPALTAAVIKPEHDTTIEAGVKSLLFEDRVLLNADVYETRVHDFQANVVDTGPGALRGYLANIDLVRVRGMELDAQWQVVSHLTSHLSASWTDGRMLSYHNGQCPLELIASTTTVCDLSGKGLPGLPKWAVSIGGEFTEPVAVGRSGGSMFTRIDASARSWIYGDSSDSKYAVISGYGIVNASVGFRQNGPWELFLWWRNLFNKEYLQNVTVQAGNSGLIVGTPGDPRTMGVTLRARF
jgi:iron complex outermembrane recepter protein